MVYLLARTREKRIKSTLSCRSSLVTLPPLPCLVSHNSIFFTGLLLEGKVGMGLLGICLGFLEKKLNMELIRKTHFQVLEGMQVFVKNVFHYIHVF